MMKTLNVCIAGFLLMGVIGCNNNRSNDLRNTQSTGANNNNPLLKTVYSTPGTTPGGTPKTTPVATPAATADGRLLNPAHGQPGHRCDLAVGAPLPVSGGPVSGLTNVNAQPNNPATVPTASSAVVASGLNPAHGQPGHRCDIAVGAPLNSKPGTGMTTPTTPTVTSSTVKPPASTVKTAPGMNPPHGQPGHRCDIAVGAPLNSKPANSVVPAPLKLGTPTPASPSPLLTDSVKIGGL